jgi:hypothetical protein
LEIGSLAASLGEDVSSAAASLFQESSSLSKRLEEARYYIGSSLTKIDAIALEAGKVDEDALPDELRSQFVDIKGKISLIRAGLLAFSEEAEKLGDVLGADMDRRYLLVFQNNSEMRGSGGFVGSYALIDVSQGKIRNIETPVGGSYDTEAGMLESIKAPAPLRLLNARWFFWDSNWWPDWPTSAQNMAYMYEKSDGPSVDGVIAITPTAVERILAVIGPIQLDDGTMIGEDNFWAYLQATVEQDNIRKAHPDLVAEVAQIEEGAPKKIIGDLAAKLIEAISQRLDQSNLVGFVSAMEASLDGKDIMFYFKDKSLEEKVISYNWAGQMRKGPLDYLMVSHTNIGGQKTDRVMSESVSHEASISGDGSIVDTVIISRSHEGRKGDAFTGVRNVDWLRIYVPAGSEIISVSGLSKIDPSLFESPDASWSTSPWLDGEAELDASVSGIHSYREGDFQVFAGWVMIDPGETGLVRISYKIPVKAQAKAAEYSLSEQLAAAISGKHEYLYNYSLLWQKQPGMKALCGQSSVSIPDGRQVAWSYPNHLEGACQLFNRDRFFTVIIK